MQLRRSDAWWGAAGGERPVRRMTNSIRLSMCGEPTSQWRSRDRKRRPGELQDWTVTNGLSLHPEKTRIVDATVRGGFEFLGYHFERGYRWPREKSIKKMRDTIRHRTRRNSGHALTVIIAGVNRSLRGWFEYFKHSHDTTFNRHDSWVRMRLRSILRKRHGLSGRGRGADHQRWPNAYFATHGLFSLVTAHRVLCQSSRR